MNQKLVLFDVDDTLVYHSDGQSVIPPETVLAINELKRHGHYVGLATGRSSPHVKHLVELLGLDAAISFGGHLIEYRGEEIYREILNQTEVTTLLKGIIHSPFPAIAMDEHHIYIKDFFGKIKKELFHDNKILDGETPITELTPIRPLDKKPRDYMLLMIFRSGLKHIERYNMLDFLEWGNKGYGVSAKGVSKLSGIVHLADYLNVGLSDVYVFGDNYNDIHMLENIEHSIAVGNGIEAAKEVASYVSPPIIEGGILTACYHMGLLEEKNE